jgi:hypothetical protein
MSRFIRQMHWDKMSENMTFENVGRRHSAIPKVVETRRQALGRIRSEVAKRVWVKRKGIMA